jgi:N utilization substance protein B
MTTVKKKKLSPRSISRSLVVQGLYHFKTNPKSASEIEEFLGDNHADFYARANYELLHTILDSAINNFDAMLASYAQYCSRELSDINTVEQCILVAAAVELAENLSVPAPVVINEAVELAKLYGAEDSYKFINGLVDKLASEKRSEEISLFKSQRRG